MRLPNYVLSLTFALLAGLITTSAWAKTIDSEKKLQQISDHFMTQVATGDTESALALIAAYLGVDAAQFEQRAGKLVNDMRRIESSAGKALSYAKLDDQRVGEHFYKSRYLLKFQQAALVWEINYYQASKGWQLVDVSFNTDIDALFTK